MNHAIVQSLEPVTLIGASSCSDRDLSLAMARAPLLVAADGGALRALELGQMPAAVIGDFDSLPAEARGRIPRETLHLAEDQDLTDFDKTLARIDAPLVLAVGFTGGRLDHELAVYNALVRSPRAAIVIGAEDICFHLAGPLELSLPVGTRVSLFPLVEMGCDSSGLRWATDGLVFSPVGRVGTSNVTVADRVRLAPSGPGMLVILPRAQLDVAVSALCG